MKLQADIVESTLNQDCFNVTTLTQRIFDVESTFNALKLQTCMYSAMPILAITQNKTLVPGRVAQSVGHLTRKSGVLGSIPGLATYFRFSFRFFKKGSCQLLAKVCARSTG